MTVNESNVQAAAMLEIARLGGLPYRNNSGVAQSLDGRPVRYGLANTSAKANAEIKSSDLICVCPTLITPAHVGSVLGVFGAFEAKPSDWKPPRETNREAYAHYAAQERFVALVRGVGGYGGFVTCDADIWRIMGLPGY